MWQMRSIFLCYILLEAKLVVRFLLRTSARSRIGNLKLEPPGPADRLVSNLLVAFLEVLGVIVRTIQLALEPLHFYRRVALRRGLQHELLTLPRRDATHRASPSPATRAPAILKHTRAAAIHKPVVLVVWRLVADDRPGPPWGVDHPTQPERDAFGRRLLVNLDYVDGMQGDLKLEYEGLAWKGFGRWLLPLQPNDRALVEGYLQAEVVLLGRLESLFGLEGHQVF